VRFEQSARGFDRAHIQVNRNDLAGTELQRGKAMEAGTTTDIEETATLDLISTKVMKPRNGALDLLLTNCVRKAGPVLAKSEMAFHIQEVTTVTHRATHGIAFNCDGRKRSETCVTDHEAMVDAHRATLALPLTETAPHEV
jgi:hypothetical protein